MPRISHSMKELYCISISWKPNSSAYICIDISGIPQVNFVLKTRRELYGGQRLLLTLRWSDMKTQSDWRLRLILPGGAASSQRLVILSATRCLENTPASHSENKQPTHQSDSWFHLTLLQMKGCNWKPSQRATTAKTNGVYLFYWFYLRFILVFWDEIKDDRKCKQ